MISSATSDYVGTYSAVSPLDRLGAALARNWWLIGLRGVLGVVFGVIALMMPIATILALVLLFSAYMLVDGAFALYAAIRAAQQREHWGLLVLQGAATANSARIEPILYASCAGLIITERRVWGNPPVRAAFRGAIARASLLITVICKLMGKSDDSHGPFWPRATTTLDDRRETPLDLPQHLNDFHFV